MKIAPHSKVVFIGDSITDCERARPVGEGLFGALGEQVKHAREGIEMALSGWKRNLTAHKPRYRLRDTNVAH